MSNNNPAYRNLILSANPDYYWTMDSINLSNEIVEIIAANNAAIVGDLSVNDFAGYYGCLINNDPGNYSGTIGGTLTTPIVINTTDSISLEFWIFYNANVREEGLGFSFLADQSEGNGFYFSATQQLGYLVNDVSNTLQVETSNAVWHENAWHHVVITITNLNFKFYLNGVLLNSSVLEGDGNIPNDQTYTVILTDAFNGNNQFPIDEFAYYSSILSAPQVTSHYNTGLPLFTEAPYVIPPHGPAAYEVYGYNNTPDLILLGRVNLTHRINQVFYDSTRDLVFGVSNNFIMIFEHFVRDDGYVIPVLVRTDNLKDIVGLSSGDTPFFHSIYVMSDGTLIVAGNKRLYSILYDNVNYTMLAGYDLETEEPNLAQYSLGRIKNILENVDDSIKTIVLEDYIFSTPTSLTKYFFYDVDSVTFSSQPNFPVPQKLSNQFGLIKNGELLSTAQVVNQVDSIVKTFDDKIVIGAGADGVIRFNNDGTVDNTFTSPVSYSGRFVGVQSTNKVVNLNDFTGGITRLNTNGTLDNTFSTDFSTGLTTVFCVRVLADDRIAMGIGVVPPMIILNPDGTEDSSFSLTLGVEYTGTGVYLIEEQAGKFIIEVLNNDTSQYSLIRLNADGTVDNTFNIYTSSVQMGSIGIQSNNKIVVGNNGAVLRLNADGTVDNTFTTTTYDSGTINAIDIFSDDKILIGSYFSIVDSIPHNFLIVLGINGNVLNQTLPTISKTASSPAIASVLAFSTSIICAGGTHILFSGNSIEIEGNFTGMLFEKTGADLNFKTSSGGVITNVSTLPNTFTGVNNSNMHYNNTDDEKLYTMIKDDPLVLMNQSGSWVNIAEDDVVYSGLDVLIDNVFSAVTVIRDYNPPSIFPHIDNFRTLHRITTLADNKVLITGGQNDSVDALNTAEFYNPTNGMFIPLMVHMQAKRTFHNSTRLNNGKVLITGGIDDVGNVVDTTELYDPNTGLFTLSGTMNTTRSNHTSTLLNNGKVLITGGTDGGDELNTAELYDPNTGLFTLTPNMTVKRKDHAAIALPDGKILLNGGDYTNIFGTGGLACEIYDPVANTFTATGDGHAPRIYQVATLLNNGKVLIAGGYANTNYPSGGIVGGDTLDSAELYDPGSGTFATISDMNTARSSVQGILLQNGKVLAAGGYDASSNSLASAELYDPVSETFTLTTFDMAVDRGDYAVIKLSNNKVLITGGFNSTNGTLASAELYDQTTDSFSSAGNM